MMVVLFCVVDVFMFAEMMVRSLWDLGRNLSHFYCSSTVHNKEIYVYRYRYSVFIYIYIYIFDLNL